MFSKRVAVICPADRESGERLVVALVLHHACDQGGSENAWTVEADVDTAVATTSAFGGELRDLLAVTGEQVIDLDNLMDGINAERELHRRAAEESRARGVAAPDRPPFRNALGGTEPLDAGEAAGKAIAERGQS